jgi:hypothetical protein
MAQGSQNKKNVEHVNEVTTRSGKNVDSPHIEEQEKSSAMLICLPQVNLLPDQFPSFPISSKSFKEVGF